VYILGVHFQKFSNFSIFTFDFSTIFHIQGGGGRRIKAL